MGDYMHIAGRTGRMGKTGTVITIVSDEEVTIATRSVEQRLNITFNLWDVDASKAVAVDDSSVRKEMDQESKITAIREVNEAAVSMKALNALWENFDFEGDEADDEDSSIDQDL